jgi:alcohol dehydrogenase class IV
MPSLVVKGKAAFGRAVSGHVARDVPMPDLVSGEGCLSQSGELCQKLDITHALIVTDQDITRLGLMAPMLVSLNDANIAYTIYDTVLPNPTYHHVQEGCDIFAANGCDGIVAFGGGSPMDCAKVIGNFISNPKPWADFQGNVLPGQTKKLPPLIAIPTTAGTGSETTVAAVISFPEERRKYAVVGKEQVPLVAILDPTLLVGLPPHITAATGMDALTHAVESYCSEWQSDFTAKYSLSAVTKIFKYLRQAFHEGTDLDARKGMLEASFEAGVAFTRANVGYVHAIAHTFGGMFHTPHGEANAMVLPHVLEFYSDNDNTMLRFAELGEAAQLGSFDKQDPTSVRDLGLRCVLLR